MGFKKTSEGRVFFKSADNDDLPSSPVSSSPESLSSKDSTQAQILLLLKTLNDKLQESRNDNARMKKTLEIYKTKIEVLEDRTLSQQNDYIDLEQKVAEKQSEASKKTSRVESGMKDALKQFEEARNLVKALESNLLEKHKDIEKRQKEQSEKLEGNVTSYVSLTKRISQTETRQDALDNKIEEATNEYLKLDRKVDKVVDDRNRLLRKIERIEGAVLETRDALNAKAMVLLTDQGAVSGVNLPDHAANAALSNEPMVFKRQIEEELMLPWWRRPVRIQTASLFLLLMVVMLLGWIMSAANSPVMREKLLGSVQEEIPTVSLGSSASAPPQHFHEETTAPSQETLYDVPDVDYDNSSKEPDFALSYSEEPEEVEPAAGENTDASSHGITIHKGYNDTAQIKNEVEEPPLDINNDAQMLAAMEKDPEAVARQLNKIEPGSLREEEKTPKVAPSRVVNEAYKISLRKKMKPDPNLPDIAKKIETQAFEGIPEAQHDMGAIYVAGRGNIKQNLERAIFWFQEAANNGVANAKYNLGVLYHQGLGVPANLSKAISLYKEAAELGHPEAQYNLGIANIEGIGVSYNPGNAARYFEKAAHQGVVEAAYNLGLIYENGLLGETQPDVALTWYKYAADAGSPEAKSAMRQLASSLGVGIEDITRIIENVKSSHTSFSNSHDRQSLIESTQSELMRRGLYPGPVDGMLGPMTRKAIENFQRAANLRADGEPSIELLQYLKASTNYSQYQ